MGQKIKQHRLKMRKSRKQFVLDLGVSQKTLGAGKQIVGSQAPC
jgi:hypothetical protein